MTIAAYLALEERASTRSEEQRTIIVASPIRHFPSNRNCITWYFILHSGTRTREVPSSHDIPLSGGRNSFLGRPSCTGRGVYSKPTRFPGWFSSMIANATSGIFVLLHYLLFQCVSFSPSPAMLPHIKTPPAIPQPLPRVGDALAGTEGVGEIEGRWHQGRQWTGAESQGNSRLPFWFAASQDVLYTAGQTGDQRGAGADAFDVKLATAAEGGHAAGSAGRQAGSGGHGGAKAGESKERSAHRGSALCWNTMLWNCCQVCSERKGVDAIDTATIDGGRETVEGTGGKVY
nr:hypothetical protein CFP56_04130 [Quercus suber]